MANKENNLNASTGARGNSQNTSSTTSSSNTRRSSAGRGGNVTGELDREVQDFVSQHRDGWNHQDWEGFLGTLQQKGQDTSDVSAIGERLERERLDQSLSQFDNIDESQRGTLRDRYGSIWNLRNADSNEVAECAGCSTEEAERIRQGLSV